MLSRSPVENIWQFMRDNWLSNRVLFYDDILDHCCFAWNKPIDMPWKIISIGSRDWAGLVSKAICGSDGCTRDFCCGRYENLSGAISWLTFSRAGVPVAKITNGQMYAILKELGKGVQIRFSWPPESTHAFPFTPLLDRKT